MQFLDIKKLALSGILLLARRNLFLIFKEIHQNGDKIIVTFYFRIEHNGYLQ